MQGASFISHCVTTKYMLRSETARARRARFSSLGYLLPKLFQSVQFAICPQDRQDHCTRFVPRASSGPWSPVPRLGRMNVHGPNFHRSQRTDRLFLYPKRVCKKNRFTLIFIVTLLLATISLRTTAASAATLNAKPGSLTFGNVTVGENSAKTITLTNSGITSVIIFGVSVSGRGYTSGLTTPLNLSAGRSISFAVHFAPATTGEVPGSMVIRSSASDRSLTIGLSGTGVQGHLSVTPPSVGFGDVVMGENSSKTLRLDNTGNGSVTISRVSVSGRGYTSGLTTPLKLSAGQSISFAAHFAPVTTGEVPGSIAITSDASDRSLTIGLSGTGVQGRLSVTPPSVGLGKVVVGEHDSQTIRLTNTEKGSVTISRANVSGSGFKIAGLTVPTVIASGKSVTFNAVFTPTSTGSRTGSVSLISNAPDSPLTIALSGTGLAATFLLEPNPSGLNFGTVNVDSTSSLSVTLTNRGNADVTISKVSVSGAGFSHGGAAAGTILGPDQSTTLRVAFAPVSAGSVHGDVVVASNATTSPMTISLAGDAVKPSPHSVALTWSASKSSGVVGYNVYRGTSLGGPFTKLTSSKIPETRYTDTSVEAARRYYYVVTAVDSSGVESSHSNQASASIPTS